MKQRIPLGSYQHVKSTYIPLLEGCGTLCDNCGRLIANIVTVKHESGAAYTIGADCAKTILGKEDMQVVTGIISYEKRRLIKIAELDRAGRDYVLDKRGWPCHDPATCSGYMIPF